MKKYSIIASIIIIICMVFSGCTATSKSPTVIDTLQAGIQSLSNAECQFFPNLGKWVCVGNLVASTATKTPLPTKTSTQIPPPTITKTIVPPTVVPTDTIVPTILPVIIPTDTPVPSFTSTFTNPPTRTSTNTPVSTPNSGTSYYVDNKATGANTGTSWANAWKSFSAITWSNIKAGATLYISGGTVTQTYNETLNINASGSAGNPITIDVGANSPSPSGHDGVVIIDGGGTRRYGIYSYGMSYININGRDSGNNYKLLLKNAVTVSDGDANLLIRNGNHVNVDYVQIICNTSRGIYYSYMTNGRIRGNDIRTGAINNTYQTDGIYVSHGYDNTVENNILYVDNAVATDSHNDPFQSYLEGRLILRNNFLESTYDADTIIIESATDWVSIYNNMSISTMRQLNAAPILLKGAGAVGAISLWNNTILSLNNNSGYVLELYQCPESSIGLIYNNIFYTVASGALIAADYPTNYSQKVNYNNYYRASGTTISDINAITRTWAQHQSAGYDVNGFNQNPLFVNPANNDYHLPTNSPLCKAGKNGTYIGAYPCQ